MTSKSDVAQVTTEIYGLLKSLSSEERQRALAAAMTLLGEAPPAISALSGGQGVSQAAAAQTTRVSSAGAASYFQSKDPKSKLEELAVAARYRETATDASVHTKEDLEKVFKDARRNFDRNNFKRDLDNAKKRGFFTRDRDITLAYFGQQFVDGLPDREAVKKLKKPKVNRGKASKRKQSSAK
jgi:hypothetical protein